jgi:hypothetical protein
LGPRCERRLQNEFALIEPVFPDGYSCVLAFAVHSSSADAQTELP